jgi:hypothetical protein
MEIKAKLEVPDQIISKAAAMAILTKSKGRMFTATFNTRGGLKAMNCQLRTVPTDKAVDVPKLEGFVPVFDLNAQDWKGLNLAQVIRLKINKVLYAVTG